MRSFENETLIRIFQRDKAKLYRVSQKFLIPLKNSEKINEMYLERNVWCELL